VSCLFAANLPNYDKENLFELVKPPNNGFIFSRLKTIILRNKSIHIYPQIMK
jgi:hypothetical protein